MGQVAIGTRLAAYGLHEADTPLHDLQVTKAADHVLSAKNTAIANQMRVLHPGSLDELKKWVGVPPGAASAHTGPAAGHAAILPRNRVTDIHALADLRKPLPTQLTKAHTDALYAAAHHFVMSSDHGLDSATISNVNKWVIALKPAIRLYFYRDIHVAAGAKLILHSSNSVLFARNIEVEKTGQIQLKAAVGKIDCASFRGH